MYNSLNPFTSFNHLLEAIYSGKLLDISNFTKMQGIEEPVAISSTALNKYKEWLKNADLTRAADGLSLFKRMVSLPSISVLAKHKQALQAQIKTIGNSKVKRNSELSFVAYSILWDILTSSEYNSSQYNPYVLRIWLHFNAENNLAITISMPSENFSY